MNAAASGPLSQASHLLSIETRGPGFTDVTHELNHWLGRIGAIEGLATLCIRHTSASLTVQENADPAVRSDLVASLARLAPEGADYQHNDEGLDDMPAHIKSMLTATSLSIPVTRRSLVLGTWQAVYVIEHRIRPHRREVALHFIGQMAG
jgi:secondary thiamine-phosphate synthase enzyme